MESLLRLWNQLHELGDPSGDPEETLELLQEARDWPASQKISLCAVLDVALTHSDQNIRAAAVSLLGEISGLRGIQYAVRALDDDHEQVRSAAVDALANVASRDATRFFYPLFHQRTDVRRQALNRDVVAGTEEFLPFLLADGECQRDVIQKLMSLRITPDMADVIVAAFLRDFIAPADWFALMNQFLQTTAECSDGILEILWNSWNAGLIPAHLLSRLGVTLGLNESVALRLDRLLIAGEQERDSALHLSAETDFQFDIAEIRFLLAAQLTAADFSLLALHRISLDPKKREWSVERNEVPCRSQKEVEHILQTARSQQGLQLLGSAPGPDVYDEILQVFWPDRKSDRLLSQTAGVEPDLQTFHLCTQLSLSAKRREESRKRFAAAVMWRAFKTGWWHRSALLAAARNYPEILTFPTIADEARDFVLHQLCSGKIPLPEYSRTRITNLILPVARRRGQPHFDLLATAAILRFYPYRRYDLGIRKLNLDDVLAAAKSDPPRAVPFFSLAYDDLSYDETVSLIIALWSQLSTDVQQRIQQAKQEASAATHADDALTSETGLPESREATSEHAGTEVAAQTARTTESRTGSGVENDIANEDAASADFGDVLAICRGANIEAAESAMRNIMDSGGSLVREFAAMFSEQPPIPLAADLAWSVMDWPDAVVQEFAVPLLKNQQVHPQVRFVVGLCLLERGIRSVKLLTVQAACEATAAPWFTEDHWIRLRQAFCVVEEIVEHLVMSYQPVARKNAVYYLNKMDYPFVIRVHRRVLERTPELLTADGVEWLLRSRDELPPALSIAVLTERDQLVASKLRRAPNSEQLIPHTMEGGLIAGNAVLPEKLLLNVLGSPHEGKVHADGLRRLIAEGVDESVRQAAAERLQTVAHSSGKSGRIADVFHWGIEASKRLTGRRYQIRLLGDERMGYMQFGRPQIFVSVVPILRGERDAEDIVKGLILHELGHHIYHSGDDFLAVNALADEESLGELFNIVLDEHLERKMQAEDPASGHLFRKVAAYVFYHRSQEINAQSLLSSLGLDAFELLQKWPVEPARTAGCVAAMPNRLWQDLESAGSSFARFFRALRMGLGNRHNDPKVGEALALFGGSFRESSAEELLQIARRLREIFGAECDQLAALRSSDRSNSEDCWTESAVEGVSDRQVQADIRRVVDGMDDPVEPDTNQQADSNARPSFNLNVTPTERFDEITTIEKLEYDRSEHQRYADRVGRQAERLRKFLLDLGLGLITTKNKSSGSRFDRGRLMSLLLRRDPRVMMSRRTNRDTDLFLSIVVDCSGSMHGRDIETARSFATLMAEAGRALPGVDVRLFGFNDSVIFDAGDAVKCAAHQLRAGGGNNDAAGLAHAAAAAMRSRRRARVVVMISDGLPTQCSVQSLKGLVRRLSLRHGIMCAQVATQDLSEICFPEYVVVSSDNIDEAVDEFGQILRRLVLKALR